MARYDGLRKIARNEQLKKYRNDNPTLSLKEIGEVFGITPSRVWRIIHGNNTKLNKR